MKPTSKVYGMAGGLSAALGYCLAVGGLLLCATARVSARDDFVLTLSEANYPFDTQSFSPSIQGSFSIDSYAIIDSSTGQTTGTGSDNYPITQVTFGIINPGGFNFSSLRYSVGIDSLSSLISLTDLSVTVSSQDFGNTGLPIYFVTGDLSTPVVAGVGTHTLNVIDESGSSTSIVAEQDAFAIFTTGVVAAPEPATFPLAAIALAAFLLLRRSLGLRSQKIPLIPSNLVIP